MSNNFEKPQQEPKEIRENLEPIQEEFKNLRGCLSSLITDLRNEGGDGENFIKGLGLEGAQNQIAWNHTKLLHKDNPTANNFAFMLFPSGIIHHLARIYAKIRAFFPQDPRFKNFFNQFEKFVDIVNNSNTVTRIKNIPELLIPIDRSHQVIDQQGSASVSSEFGNLPGVRQKARESQQKADADPNADKTIVVDFGSMHAYAIDKQGNERIQGSEAVIIAPRADWNI